MDKVTKNDENKVNAFDEVINDVLDEIRVEKKLNILEYKKEIAKNKNMILRLIEKILGKFIIKIRLRVCMDIQKNGEWTQLFEYIIPKN